jgi:hypothetical protein
MPLVMFNKSKAPCDSPQRMRSYVIGNIDQQVFYKLIWFITNGSTVFSML